MSEAPRLGHIEGVINVEALLARHGGLIVSRDHRELKSSLSRWARQGKVIRLMRGVYAHPNAGVNDRIRAVQAAIPGAVIAGQTALALATGAHRATDVIQVCTPTHRTPQPGFEFTQRVIPREHAPRGIMTPALAAVDICDRDPSWLDDLARKGKATANTYEQILSEFSCRPGNSIRRRKVARTTTRPWSMAERAYHDVLDTHRVRGWVGNYAVRVDGKTYVLDIAFPAQKLALEIDGRAYHTDWQAYENDCERQNALADAGWTVLRFTWAMLSDPDRIVERITSVLTGLRRRHRS